MTATATLQKTDQIEETHLVRQEPAVFIGNINGNYPFVTMSVNNSGPSSTAATCIAMPLDPQLIAKDLFQRRIDLFYPTKLIFRLSIWFIIMNVLILLCELLFNVKYDIETQQHLHDATTKRILSLNGSIVLTSLVNILYGVLAMISSKI
jgi:hypothetical protein